LSLAPSPNLATSTVEYGYFGATQTQTRQNQKVVKKSSDYSKKLGERGTQSPAQILVSFRVEQSGQELRVIDSDGSVYAGPVQTSTSALRGISLREQPVTLGGSVTTAPRQERAMSSGTQNQNALPVSLFQVVGTNRSSNQRVTFSGTMAGSTNLLDSSRFSQPTTRLASPAARQDAASGRMYLSGTAVIGDGEELKIEATPIPQKPLRQ
jgi:hypothetical protein